MKISNETKVGVLAAIAIAVLIIGYNFLKGNDIFNNDTELYAVYDRVDGLTTSKPVLVNGFQIGRVAKLTLLPNGKIVAMFKINKSYQVPDNSIAKLESTDLLGGKAIIFKLGNSTKYVSNGDTLNANVSKGLLEQVEPVQKKAEVIVARLDSILTSVNSILNPNFQKNVDKSFTSIAHTLESLESASKKVDGLVGTQGQKIAGILTNVESITNNLKNNNAKITNILSNADKMMDQVAASNFKETVENANKMLVEMKTVVGKINSGNGSLGLLINDPKLYDNLKNAAGNLDKLMIDLKANPKRYVHFSVFGGGKDKPKDTTTTK